MLFTKIIDTQQSITTDITGQLPVTSNQRNKYLFVLYKYDRNSILVHPMKARTDKEFIRVFQDLCMHLTTRGLNPNYMQLDNDALSESQDLLKENRID